VEGWGADKEEWLRVKVSGKTSRVWVSRDFTVIGVEQEKCSRATYPVRLITYLYPSTRALVLRTVRSKREQALTNDAEANNRVGSL